MSPLKALKDLDIQRDLDSTVIPEPSFKWFSRLVLPAGIIVIALLLLAFAARTSLWPVMSVRTVKVIAKKTISVSGSVTVQAPGWVEADPFPIYVPALTPGIVREVLVLEGERVKAGQVIARMIADDAGFALDAAKAKYTNRQAELDIAKANLSAALQNWENPIEQDRAVAFWQAKQQEMLAQEAVLKSDIVLHKAKLAELNDQYKRLQALLPDAASKGDVAQAGYRCDAQKAQLISTEKSLNVISARALQYRANLTAAQETRKLRITEKQSVQVFQAQVKKILAMVQQESAAVSLAQLRYDRMEIRSAVDGVVMERLAVPGSKLSLGMDNKTSANVVHLYDPDKLQVRVDVPLVDAANVAIGQQTEVFVEVLPDKRYQGYVSRIVHQADIQKNTLEVKVAIKHPTAQLKPQMLARVKFLATVPKDQSSSAIRTFVPKHLIRNLNGNTGFVWVVTADSTVHKQSISLGSTVQQGWVDVISGLNPGDEVITEPLEGLAEGQRVQVSQLSD